MRAKFDASMMLQKGRSRDRCGFWGDMLRRKAKVEAMLHLYVGGSARRRSLPFPSHCNRSLGWRWVLEHRRSSVRRVLSSLLSKICTGLTNLETFRPHVSKYSVLYMMNLWLRILQTDLSLLLAREDGSCEAFLEPSSFIVNRPTMRSNPAIHCSSTRK